MVSLERISLLVSILFRKDMEKNNRIYSLEIFDQVYQRYIVLGIAKHDPDIKI